MTAETLALVAGVIISLLFSYVPGLNVKFGALASEVKRVILLGLMLGVGIVAFLLSCTTFGGLFGIPIACTQGGFSELIKAFVFAAIANQTTYQLSTEAKAVTLVKAKRDIAEKKAEKKIAA
jgi:hypothetical protein